MGALRCAACGMRLSEEEAEVVLRQWPGHEAGGILRRYHPGCQAAARKLLEEAPEEWVMGLRFVPEVKDA